MKSRVKSLQLLTFLLAVAAAAQDVQIAGPGGQLLFDPASRSVRRINGAPGGAHLSQPVLQNLDLAAVSPDGASVLAVREGQLVLLRGIASPDLSSESVLANALEAAKEIRWSPDSNAAVIAAGSRVQQLRQLNDTPIADESIEFDGAVRILAVDADGRQTLLAVASAGGAGDQLYLLQRNQEARIVAQVGSASSGVFLPDGTEFFVADRSARQILRFFTTGSATGAPVLDSNTGIEDPSALAVTKTELIVANQSTRNIRSFRLVDLTLVSERAVDEEPVLLEPVPQSAYYRLTRRSQADETLILLDSRADKQIFFVPAGR